MIPSAIDTLFDPVMGCLRAESLWLYSQGKHEPKIANAIEKHLVECAFCAEALEGIATQPDLQSFQSLVCEVNENVANHVSSVSAKAKVVESKKIKQFSFYRAAMYITSAAAVILIAVLIWPSSNSSALPLPNGIYEIYQGDATRGEDEDAIFSAAMDLYNEKKYEAASAKFVEVNSAQSWFFYGNCQLELQHYDKALESYDKVIALKNGYEENASWYRALTLICKGDKVAGIHSLESIYSKPGDYSAKAEKLLKELR